MIHPEISIMIELRLGRTGKLPAKDPKLSFIRLGSYGLMAASRRRSTRCFYHCPFVLVDVVEKHIAVDDGLLAIVEFTAEHDELVLERMWSQGEIDPTRGWSYNGFHDFLPAGLFLLDLGNDFFDVILERLYSFIAVV